MNNYLSLAKSSLNKLNNYNKVYIVIGNESCDLDSAVSALVYGYFLHSVHNSTEFNTPVLPILNIQEDEFPLRTETKYFLHKLNIDTSLLICRNNIDIKQLSDNNKLQLILVDHHVLPTNDKYLEKSVIEVIDHRPEMASWKDIPFILNTVGSCATLIANIIISKNLNKLGQVTAKLLHGTIILDTINFNTSANRFTELDVEIANKLEQNFKIEYSREEIFNELVSARSDVSSLTPFQILHRDLKILNGVPIPGIPMLISEFLTLPDAANSLKKFCESKNSKVFIPMGLVTKNDKVFREIAVYSIEGCELEKVLIEQLKNSSDLKLTEIQNTVNGLTLFSQANVKASRKQIIPIISPVIIGCRHCNNL